MAISTIWVLKTVVKGIIFTSLLLLFYFLHMRHAIDQYSKGITTIGQEPLKKWMEHSNFPLQGRGDTKIPIVTETPTFFLKKMWKYFPKHIKAESMIKFDIFHILAENSVNSVICFFWALLQAAKIWNSSKNAHVWAA